MASCAAILELHTFDPAALKDAAREQGVTLTEILAIKGFGSGLEMAFAADAWEVAKGFDCLVWDGDWLKEDSFTSFIAEFLKEPRHHGLAFRKASGKLDGFLQSWSPTGLLGRIVLVLVSDECVEGARTELRSYGVPEPDLDDLCLGWLSMRLTGARTVLAVGGGHTTAREAQATLRLPDMARPRWEVLPICRTKEGRQEPPEELLEALCERSC
ncbi:unnamed protein product [Effrenium voratum]|uniref:Uncharacterized protein n=1 Tax=Effrenium voratum TaxID=2562239 RepID=A0AA36HVA3_9DINO|nr:unnamed protein product [Effrenium voratum]